MADIDQRPTSGFIVIYRWQVERADEENFKSLWRKITIEGRGLGALGSCLTREQNGDFLAIALWPSEQARADAFVKMTPRPDWKGAKRISETKLQVVDDLWSNSPLMGLGSAKLD